MLTSRISKWCYGFLLTAGLLVLTLYSFGGRLSEVVPEWGLPYILLHLAWGDVATSEVTAEEAEALYATHRDVMMDIVEVCRRHPRLNRVAAFRRSFFERKDHFYGEGLVGSELLSAADLVRTRMAQIPAEQVVCWRWHHVSGQPLAGVSFTLYAVGMVLEGELKRIEYDTEWLRGRVSAVEKRVVLTEEEIGRGSYGYIELPDEGWYLLVTKS